MNLLRTWLQEKLRKSRRYDMGKDMVRKRNEEWEGLEQTIIDLVKEYYRLSGMVAYEPLDQDWDSLVQGGDDGQPM